MRNKMLCCLLALFLETECQPCAKDEKLDLTCESGKCAKEEKKGSNIGAKDEKNEREKRAKKEKKRRQRTRRPIRRRPYSAVCGASMPLAAIADAWPPTPARADFVGVPPQTASCRPSAAPGHPCPGAAEPRRPGRSPAIRVYAAGIAARTALCRRASAAVAAAEPSARAELPTIRPAAKVSAPAAPGSRPPLIAAEASLSPFRQVRAPTTSVRKRWGGRGGVARYHPSNPSA